MNLAPAPERYDRAQEQRTREETRRADEENFKRGRDLFLVQGERLVLKSPDGTQWKIEVDNAGVISATAI